MKATDPEKRKTAAIIADKVGGTATEQSCKEPIARLKTDFGLVDTKTGKGGGTWLTTKGLDLINRNRPMTKP